MPKDERYVNKRWLDARSFGARVAIKSKCTVNQKWYVSKEKWKRPQSHNFKITMHFQLTTSNITNLQQSTKTCSETAGDWKRKKSFLDYYVGTEPLIKWEYEDCLLYPSALQNFSLRKCSVKKTAFIVRNEMNAEHNLKKCYSLST